MRSIKAGQFSRTAVCPQPTSPTGLSCQTPANDLTIRANDHSINLCLTRPPGAKHTASIAGNQIMKVITHKQVKPVIDHIAGLLKKDGANQTLTVQEWLDVAQLRPAQFPSSLPALEVLGLLGFGDEVVQAEPVG
jgi:hypothetical protein